MFGTFNITLPNFTIERLIRDNLPPQPPGFEVKALACAFCEDRTRLAINDKIRTADVEAWIKRHEKCGPRQP